jgi:hypothetical protein
MGACEEFAAKFDDEDDPDLWRAALQYILAEIEQRRASRSRSAIAPTG